MQRITMIPDAKHNTDIQQTRAVDSGTTTYVATCLVYKQTVALLV